MSITEVDNAFVNTASESIALSQMFAVTAATADPAYLVLTVVDRNEYIAGASGATGSLSGDGHTLNLSNIGGDGRGAGIVFSYQASSGRYYSTTYGYLDQLTYTSSGSLDDVTSLSLFGVSNLTQANAYAANVYSMMQAVPAGYLGSATVVTQPNFTSAVPSQATPDSIAAVASSFVGQAWNMDGCWVLASTIAAEAGASLPVQSTLIGLPGQANGEWIVAFNGPAGQAGNWQPMVTAGEIVAIGTPGGGGHITTCVAGSGSSAMLVDNITYIGSNGHIQNAANDGSSSDVIIAAAHPASQEWAGVQASTVVIYELDAPCVTEKAATETLAYHGSLSLGSVFAATDPANKAIAAWQIYDTSSSDSLSVGGVLNASHSAATALSTTSLASVTLLAGSTATVDTLEVRASNGTYWGDWEALTVTVGAAAAAAPVLVTQTANQTWTGGKALSLVLPAGTFSDPQHEALTYTAQIAGGQALPSWLTFNSTTEAFTGTAPTTAQSLSISVTATDTSGLSASETFTATILGAPQVTSQTPNQTWTEGNTISLALPANTFTDPQGEALTYNATLSNGQALPSWLTFNAANETFTGTAPSTAQSLNISVTAKDSAGLTASESFMAAVQSPATVTPLSKPGITLTNPTPSQTWRDGSTVNFVLPSNTFTDALGLQMTFVAYEVSGPNVTSWLHFSGATDTLHGTVPAAATGTIGIEIFAFDSKLMTASDLFTVKLAPATGHASPGNLTAAMTSALQPAPAYVHSTVAFQT